MMSAVIKAASVAVKVESVQLIGMLLIMLHLTTHLAPGMAKAIGSTDYDDIITGETITQTDLVDQNHKLCMCSTRLLVSGDSGKSSVSNLNEISNSVNDDFKPEEAMWKGSDSDSTTKDDTESVTTAPREDTLSQKDEDEVKKKEKEDSKVIKQVIFIEPPEYVYNHQLSINQAVRKPPKTVIYVFPPEIKHIYNITDNRMFSKNPSEPIVYYLTNQDIINMHGQTLLDSHPQDFSEDHNNLSQHLEETNNYSQQDVDFDVNKSSIENANATQEQELINYEPPIYVNNLDELNMQMLNSHNYNNAVDSKDSSDEFVRRNFEISGDKNMPQDKAGDNGHDNFHNSNTEMEYSSASNENESQQSNFNNYPEAELQGSDFEIIPAILERYFYIGPDGDFREIHLNR